MFKKQTYYAILCLMLSMAFTLTQAVYAEDKIAMKGNEKGSAYEQKGASQEEMDPAMAEMMAQWQKYMTPGEGHKVLDKLVGNWNHTMQHWMSADSPPDETSGTSEISWMMGGRYLKHTVKGSWNGQPFEGLGIIGFDNLTKQYNTIWLDNMGTGIMKSKGDYDSMTSSITEAGNFSCPMTNSTREYRAVTKFINENSFTYETYMTDETGQEFRAMLITYTKS